MLIATSKYHKQLICCVNYFNNKSFRRFCCNVEPTSLKQNWPNVGYVKPFRAPACINENSKPEINFKQKLYNIFHHSGFTERDLVFLLILKRQPM